MQIYFDKLVYSVIFGLAASAIGGCAVYPYPVAGTVVIGGPGYRYHDVNEDRDGHHGRGHREDHDD